MKYSENPWLRDPKYRRDLQIVNEYSKFGATLRDVGEQFGMSKEGIRTILGKHYPDLLKDKKNVQDMWAITLYEMGVSKQDVVKLVKRTCIPNTNTIFPTKTAEQEFCAVDNCRAKIDTRGMCRKHYRQWLGHRCGRVCKIEGCDNPVNGVGMCGNHYNIQRRKDNINHRLAGNLRSRYNTALNGQLKVGSFVDDIGCTIDEFRQHIENLWEFDMSWNNYGQGKEHWHIDHIKQLVRFNLEDRKQFLLAAHYTNCRPMWAEENWKRPRHG